MALDLWLTIVPGKFDSLVKKANEDKAYAEWLAFTDSMLRDQDFNDFDDEAAMAVRNDVLQLKDHYNYTPLDFFYDENRITSTLDYLLDREIESRRLNVPTGILWEAGIDIDDHCRSGQGIPLKLYTREQIELIYDFIGTIEFETLVKHYDDEKMVAFGVYKLQSGNQENVAYEFSQIKTIFKRAFLHEDAYILKKID